MALYAIITGGVVTGFYTPSDTSTPSADVAAGIISPAIAAAAVPVPLGGPIPVKIGTPYNPLTGFVFPVPLPLDPLPAGRANATGGITITCTSAGWTSTFSTTTDAIGNNVLTALLVEQDALNLSSGASFSNGASTLHWKDTASPPVTRALTPTMFAEFKAAMIQFISQSRDFAIGVSGATLPSSTVTIA